MKPGRLERRTELRRVPMPPRRAGLRAGREDPAVTRFRVAVRRRCAGVCEARTPVCWGVVDPLLIDAHHIGGRVGPFAHEPDVNGLGVCRACHDWIGEHLEQAYELGLAARRNAVDNPAVTGRRLGE